MPAALTLHDIELRSLKGVDTGVFAAELARLKVVPFPEAAQGLLDRTPSVLARYVGPKAAENICRSLQATGAEVWLPVSQITCPHCGFSVLCEGEPNRQQDGIIFCCRACQGLTLLSVTEARFRAVLRCGACGSLVDLPAKTAAGQYSCSCGRTLDYTPPKQIIPLTVERRPFPVRACVAAVCVVVLVCTGVWNWSLVTAGPDPEVAPGSTEELSVVEPRSTRAYREFDARTDRAGVVAALGAPERESGSERGEELALFYRRYGLYVVLERNRGTYSYLNTVRISDERILHERPGLR